MIADILSTSIDEIRATKDNQFFYEFDMPPTDEEVDEFIISRECFDDEMKKWLIDEVEINSDWFVIESELNFNFIKREHGSK